MAPFWHYLVTFGLIQIIMKLKKRFQVMGLESGLTSLSWYTAQNYMGQSSQEREEDFLIWLFGLLKSRNRVDNLETLNQFPAWHPARSIKSPLWLTVSTVAGRANSFIITVLPLFFTRRSSISKIKSAEQKAAWSLTWRDLWYHKSHAILHSVHYHFINELAERVEVIDRAVVSCVTGVWVLIFEIMPD